MSSAFDDLLGDFGDSGTTSTTTTTKTSTTNDSSLDFDPFGPSSHTTTTTSNTNGDGNNSGLLLDFSSEVNNGDESSNGHLNFQFETSTSHTSNPLDDMSTGQDKQQQEQPSSNPLYDLSTSGGSSGNPLYDLTTQEDAGQSPNLLYDASAQEMEQPAQHEHGDVSDDVVEEHAHAQSDEVPAQSGHDLLGDDSELHVQHEDEHVGVEEPAEDKEKDEVEEREEGPTEYPLVMNGDAQMFLGTSHTEEYQQEPEKPEKEELPTQEQVQDEEPHKDDTTEAVAEEEVGEHVEETPEAQGSIEEGPAHVEKEEEVVKDHGGDSMPDLVVKEEGDEHQHEPEEPKHVEEQEQRQEEPEHVEEQEQRQEEPEQHVEEQEQQQEEPKQHVEEQKQQQEEQEHHVEEAEQQLEEPVQEPEKQEHEPVEVKEEADAGVAVEPTAEIEDQPAEAAAAAADDHAENAPQQTAHEDVYTHDKREEDLEQYCIDREEEASEVSECVSDVPPTPTDQEELAIPKAPEQEQVEPEVQQEEPVLSEPDAAKQELEHVEDVASSAAPEEEEIVQGGHTTSKTSYEEKRHSGSGFEPSPITDTQWEDSRNKQNAELDYADAPVNSQVSAPEPAPRRQMDIQQQPDNSALYDDDEEEEGVHENEPIRRDDVVRESDKTVQENLPAAGTAQNLRAKFLSGEVSTATSRSKREITPPNPTVGGGEYVSEPRSYVEKYEGKADSGVFESQPNYNDDVVRADSHLEEKLPEQGSAKNMAARFREMGQSSAGPAPTKREITPDRSGRVEFVSEPRGQVEQYEGRAESGVFESQPEEIPDVVRSGEGVVEELPERGTAKNMANKFRQISQENQAPARGKREITPDTSGSRGEYVSEPRSHVETYENKVESGVFENEPQDDPEVVKADSMIDEYLPEQGFARNVAAKFRNMESTPPVSPGRRKEFTPPREDTSRQSGVYENTPEVKQEVVHSEDMLEEKLPERGTAKNMAQKFRQMEVENRSPPGPKAKKEFTPPPRDTGVFENQPQQFQADYNRPAESGILENQPQQRSDVVRESEPPKFEEELPDRGMARNLVNRWKQMESTSAGGTSPGSGGKPKEFTPPRDEPRIAEQRKSPRTPKSPAGNAQMDNGSVHPSELPGQYQPQNEPSVFESTPNYLPDAVREADTDWTDGMPKKDTAKKMLARFKSIQDEAKKETPPPVTRKDSENESSPKEPEAPMENARLKFEDPEKVGRSKSMRASIQTEKCGACEKTVYAMERLEMNKHVYHKACFRCSQCRSVLTPKTFAINNGVIFCTTHYKQLFTTKGNYDEGFGRTQHKKRWNSHPNLADGEEEGTKSPSNGKS